MKPAQNPRCRSNAPCGPAAAGPTCWRLGALATVVLVVVSCHARRPISQSPTGRAGATGSTSIADHLLSVRHISVAMAAGPVKRELHGPSRRTFRHTFHTWRRAADGSTYKSVVRSVWQVNHKPPAAFNPAQPCRPSRRAWAAHCLPNRLSPPTAQRHSQHRRHPTHATIQPARSTPT